VPGRRRGTVALSKRPREEERGLRRSWALRPVVGLRRCQGGGEAPPLYRNAPGRRRGGFEGQGIAPLVLLAATSGRRREAAAGTLGLREEERARRVEIVCQAS
jgi:hypothetical protein